MKKEKKRGLVNHTDRINERIIAEKTLLKTKKKQQDKVPLRVNKNTIILVDKDLTEEEKQEKINRLIEHERIHIFI